MVRFDDLMAQRYFDTRYGAGSVFSNNGSAAILHMSGDVVIGKYVQANIFSLDSGVILPALFVVPIEGNYHKGIISEMLLDNSINVPVGELPPTSGVYDSEHGLMYDVVGAGGCFCGGNELTLMKNDPSGDYGFGPNDAHLDEISKHFKEWALKIS